MPKTYKCLQCDKTFKRKNYRLKHVRNQHQFFQCEICSQHIKEGSRTVHILRCKRREQLKTTRCLLCNKNFAFDNILYHLKNTHNVWEHIKISPKPAARSPPPMMPRLPIPNYLLSIWFNFYNLVLGLIVTQFRISIQFSGKKYPGQAPNNLLRLVICNRLVTLGISKQQHLYLKTKNLI